MFCAQKSSLHAMMTDSARANTMLRHDLRQPLTQLAKRKTQKSSGARALCTIAPSQVAQNARAARRSTLRYA